ncbi:MAG: hypothetical protein JNJ41_11435 [Bacteroidia bacterium]|nr:hypothetical protein [Bacteroidia bacterium]
MGKHLITILLFFASIGYGQIGLINNETWLYKFSKTEKFPNKWTETFSPFGSDKIIYSIYYALNGKWEYVGNITTNTGMKSMNIYFKSGYRVAYGIKEEKPTEIVFEKNKDWNVE